MAECSHNCENCSADCGERKAESLLFHSNGNIKNVIGIVSGKGGVGKSLVTSLLASEMRKKGFRTSILDADITGPSIPKCFGLSERVLSDGHFIMPAISKNGTKIISMNLCLADERDPVVWRGPVIAGVLQQFYEEVDWGLTDYMFVDMPPGTGDVPLTVFQSIPVKGIIIVTTPQELVEMVVSKALKMADLMKIPVLGLVENMSYFECPDCGKRHHIFGESNIENVAKTFNVKAVSEIPINPKLADFCDKGEIESFDASESLYEVLKVLENL